MIMTFMKQLVVLLVIAGAVTSIRIVNLAIPASVENGTKYPILLDCDYTFNREERQIAIRWFFNDAPEPIYQWLPQINKRTVDPKFLKRIDMKYRVAEDELKKYRAVRILNPTTELTGRYSCQVLSEHGHDTRTKKLIVFAPAKKMVLQSTDLDKRTVNVTCEAEGVFPRPSLNWFHRTQDGKIRKLNVNPTVMKYNQDYSAKFHAQINRTSGVNYYDCVLSIPGTNYKKTETIKLNSYDKKRTNAALMEHGYPRPASEIKSKETLGASSIKSCIGCLLISIFAMCCCYLAIFSEQL